MRTLARLLALLAATVLAPVASPVGSTSAGAPHEVVVTPITGADTLNNWHCC